jgi:hypothetical protein
MLQHIPKFVPEIPQIRFDGKFLVSIPETTQKMLGSKLKELIN